MALSRVLLPILLILVSIIGLGAVNSMTVTTYTTYTSSTTTVLTTVNPEILLEYSYANTSCTTAPSSNCFQQVSPYTETQMWTGQTTQTVPAFSTSASQVPYANTGMGAAIEYSAAIVLVIGVILFLILNRRTKV
jgi:hypothetical protein